MHVDRVQVAGVQRAGDLQLRRHTDVHAVQLLPADARDRGLPRDLKSERHDVDPTGLDLEGTTETLLDELQVLLDLLVPALDLDTGLETDGESLDLLVDRSALDTHLALDDPARHDVLLGQLGLDGRAAGAMLASSLLKPIVTPPRS